VGECVHPPHERHPAGTTAPLHLLSVVDQERTSTAASARAGNPVPARAKDTVNAR
jgi:hypothetical protein